MKIYTDHQLGISKEEKRMEQRCGRIDDEVEGNTDGKAYRSGVLCRAKLGSRFGCFTRGEEE